MRALLAFLLLLVALPCSAVTAWTGVSISCSPSNTTICPASPAFSSFQYVSSEDGCEAFTNAVASTSGNGVVGSFASSWIGFTGLTAAGFRSYIVSCSLALTAVRTVEATVVSKFFTPGGGGLVSATIVASGVYVFYPDFQNKLFAYGGSPVLPASAALPVSISGVALISGSLPVASPVPLDVSGISASSGGGLTAAAGTYSGAVVTSNAAYQYPMQDVAVLLTAFFIFVFSFMSVRPFG